MDSELKSHDLRSSFSSETELRKRTQALANQAKNLHPKADTIEYKERQHQQQNGHKEKEFYPMSPSAHKTSYQLTRTPPIKTPTTITSAETTSKVASVLMNSNLNVDITPNRRFSESSADELYRSDESTKRTALNKIMGYKALVNTNNSNAQLSNRRKCPRFSNDDDDDGESCCCFDGDNRKRRLSDAIDVGIRVMLVFIFISLETTKPFKRKVHPEEMWLYKNPRTPDIVSAQTLILSVIFGPLFVTLFNLWLSRDRRDFRAASWVWTLALGLNGVTTSLLKITVGRHRPDFFYRCFPNGIVVLNNATDSNGSLDYYNCTGDLRQICEGRKSFPSGHASFAFVGLGFIAIYVAAKLHALSARGRGQSWRLCVSILPLILAALIAVSRTCDYHHHWEDVVAGSLIGLFCTYVVYRQYYPSLYSIHCQRPYLRTCERLTQNYKQLNLQSKTHECLSSKENINEVSDLPEDERRRLI
ncbi:PA-phosphatase related-family protein DDB_G0275547 [Bactrocera oleae]|uniref:PA-phosphatase related-family protein DDB_G0275547 n=1 Tax=Bactrocera oleae TaxID=104688 RepID=UPI0006B83C6A|nr:PA-phosphatase related-family protein DDB_G0275547 [Bactrocera oleae]XP_014088746.1 PA-phosphatase related-family protein DDB_G0275547 [Bactrocera oleae]